ncbi:MAG: peptide chain release factor N(5)-glutamine methyltransferase, partial [Coriobacteriales bacterium]|nr:peptide chain release factor N(5)-glutamine methyltransferase [Coriobacteriales bacterium]
MDWTIRTTLEWTQAHFARAGEENPRLAAQLLVGQATGLSRLDLYLDYDRPLSLCERDCLRALITRRDGGEPLQYLIGRAPFRHLELHVRPGVLIPRPETETLVDLVLAALPPRARVVEIGTGSGCVALALLDELADCQVIATDNSPEALALARENAQLWWEGRGDADSTGGRDTGAGYKTDTGTVDLSCFLANLSLQKAPHGKTGQINRPCVR